MVGAYSSNKLTPQLAEEYEFLSNKEIFYETSSW